MLPLCCMCHKHLKVNVSGESLKKEKIGQMTTKDFPHRMQFLANCLQLKSKDKLINIKMKMCPNMILITNMTSIFLCYHLNVMRLS